jgi:LPS-assembly protein
LQESDDIDTSPFIMPVLDYNFIGQPDTHGGRWLFDANFRSITRSVGEENQRIALKSGWELPHIAPSGQIYNFYATMEGAAYLTKRVVRGDRATNDTFTGLTGRIVPRIGLDWRFPFARTVQETTQIFEPLIGGVLSPNARNSSKIPNDDSINFEFDDTNLSSPSRFPGLDRVDGGARLHYGLKWGIYGSGGGYTTAFIGQSFRPRRDGTYEPRSGLEDNFSDLAGTLQIKPSTPFDLTYRFRMRKSDLSMERSEVNASIGPPALKLGTRYIFVDEGGGSGEIAARHEISPSLSSRLTEKWSINSRTTINLEESNEMRTFGFGLVYTCKDCLTVTFNFTRDLLVDRDVKPSDTFFVRFQFATLGEITTVRQR